MFFCPNALGVSQEKLAEMAGLSWQTINSLECRRTWAGDGTLEALARVFNIESFQLLMPPKPGPPFLSALPTRCGSWRKPKKTMMRPFLIYIAA
jgi:transcriptional regulator with XRE-family HTH domain